MFEKMECQALWRKSGTASRELVQVLQGQDNEQEYCDFKALNQLGVCIGLSVTSVNGHDSF